MAASRLRVAVIGAGGAGLCSARHILSRPVTFEPPVVFEMSGEVGGTWVYTEEVGGNSRVHSSMYRDLRTNLPKEIMEFPDFAFDPSLPSFIHHSEVLRYLEDYADHFSIRPHIKFNTRVVSVSPVAVEGEGETVSWRVTSDTQGDDDPVTEEFDAVMVCVGHYSQPLMPEIEGLQSFQGQVVHSHYYRFPEVFASRSVVLLGGGPSGIDIAIELSSHAKHVTLSCRGSTLRQAPPENASLESNVALTCRGPPLQWTPPENVLVVPPVVRASPTSLVCEDGTEVAADTFIFCTGYKYYYPFLLPGDEVMVSQQEDQREELLRKNTDFQEEKLEFEKGLELNEETLKREDIFNVKSGFSKRDLLEGEDTVGPGVEPGHLPPLYKHLIHARYPSMCFIGAVKIVVPFPLFHCQVQFFLSVLEGKCKLPSPEQMLSESREEVRTTQSSGTALKYLHRLGPKQWEYNQWLADTAGFEPLAPVLGKLYEGIRVFRSANPILYRKLNIRILNREEYDIDDQEMHLA
ncbi:uncharacterized protein [Hyperolius riggenbachi]|uniref:uncharacterized protein n=1 Tax=Hyperolius riggenbachi TaxID=752182 RepID=UPI0035A3771E